MAYVVVCFADNSVSEVPTNWLYEYEGDTMCWWPPPSIKNTSMLISKCVDPDKKSWNLMSVTVQKYFVSLEKARDAAANDNYISTDDQCLGKGHRKKISNTLIHSDADEERNHDKKSYRTSKNNPKVYNRKTVNVSIQDEQSDDFIENEQSIDNVLPVWPADMQSSTNNDNTVNFVTNVYQKNMKQKKSCDLSRQNSQMSESNSTSINECEDPLNTNNIGEKADLNTQQRIEAKVDTLLRTTAEIHLKLDDVSAQLANTLIRKNQNHLNTETIRTSLPLKCIDDIKKLEAQLKTDKTLYNEYKTFIQKVGGHSPREHVRNILAKVFCNECAIKCSWKGRRQNFAVSKLLLITVMKDVILGHHAVTEKDLDIISAEWFRFAKQRKNREEKEN